MISFRNSSLKSEGLRSTWNWIHQRLLISFSGIFSSGPYTFLDFSLSGLTLWEKWSVGVKDLFWLIKVPTGSSILLVACVRVILCRLTSSTLQRRFSTWRWINLGLKVQLSLSPQLALPHVIYYVDDILVFLKVLRLYQDSSGHSFNLQKRQLFLDNCNVRQANMVHGLLQINQAFMPSVYLGVPLFFGSWSSTTSARPRL